MPGDQNLPEHDNTKIKVHYAGDQPMDVILMKDGQKISDSGDQIKYTVFDDYIMIFIKDISQQNAGKLSF